MKNKYKKIRGVLPPPPKDRVIKESSWLETLTFGLYKTKSYHKRNEDK